jgi:hypothetical protein
MDWTTALTGGSVVASVILAGVTLVALSAFFNFSWRTAVAAAVIAVTTNLFVRGGAPYLVFTVLRPLHAFTTLHPPEPVEESPHPYPPNR